MLLRWFSVPPEPLPPEFQSNTIQPQKEHGLVRRPKLRWCWKVLPTPWVLRHSSRLKRRSVESASNEKAEKPAVYGELNESDEYTASTG